VLGCLLVAACLAVGAFGLCLGFGAGPETVEPGLALRIRWGAGGILAIGALLLLLILYLRRRV
jgi:hypothetical protein